jgi:isopenicillin-N N-acyltransferase like protein
MRRMRSQVLFVLLVGLIGLGRAESPAATPPKVKGASFSQVEKVPLLSLSGSPEQIGQQEAKLVGNRAKELLSFGPTLVKRRIGEAGWKAHAFVSRALLENASQAHRDEIAAFQKASGLPQDELVASQTIYDTINAFGCSSILVPAERSSTGGPLFGRNFDYASLGLLHANDLVKVVRPEGKFAFASVSFPACFGVISGMNEHGLAIALHEVRQAADGSARFNPEGVPTLLALRQVLEECRTIEEAKTLLTKLPRTTMYNLALCDPNGGAVLEVTTKNVILRKEEGINACTNHFRAKELCVDKTCQRFDSLMAKESGQYSIDKVFAKLDSTNQGERTFQSMVFEPKALVMHVAIEERPSTHGTLRKLDLKELFAK